MYWGEELVFNLGYSPRSPFSSLLLFLMLPVQKASSGFLCVFKSLALCF